MAIIINSTPENYPSAHDDLFFVVSSDQVATAGFKYVFDVYINSSLITRIKLFPDPINAKGIFNASAIVRDYLASYFKPNATATAFSFNGDDIFVSYEVRFGEDYNGTTYTNLASGTYKAFNFVNPLFRDFSTSYFQPKINTWLTSRDITAAECGYSEKLFAGWLNTAGSTTNLTLTVQKYLPSGANDGTAVTGGAIPCSAFVLFDLSPAALNAYLTTTTITTATYMYGVKVNYGGNSSAEFKIKNVCNPRWTPINLHFLNRLGGYDSFGFRLVNRQSGSVTKKSFEQMPWQYSSGNMTRYDGNKRMNAGNNTFMVNETVKFKLSSDYINQTDYLWLKDLITSPEVYFEKDGYYYPIEVKETSWSEKLRIADKMFNFELDIEFGNKINSQYR